jgi:hypothetical protein
MTMQLKTVFLSAALAALVLPAAAQSTGDTTSQPAAQKPATIKQRKENQQDRIGNGIQSGQLTAGEAARLEKKEAAVNKEERQMKKDGDFTPAERAKVQHQQNRLSKSIYKQKHDAQVQNTNPKSEVGQRQRNQQERIAQGVKSGQLTAGEAGHLEGREAAINKEVHTERAANGGKLTPAERAQVNRQENRTSRAIYRKKHNARQQ